jgi:hypothetical protein
MPAPQGHTHFDANDKAYWTALAWLLAGKAERAKRFTNTLEAPPFTLHAASVLALKLRTDAALGKVSRELQLLAETMVGSAPPLEAEELRGAMREADRGP